MVFLTDQPYWSYLGWKPCKKRAKKSDNFGTENPALNVSVSDLAS